MALKSVIQITTAPPRTGKTYRRCAWFLINEWLPYRAGKHISNFPLGVVPENHDFPPKYQGETFKRRIAERVAREWGGEAEQYESRIISLPDDELQKWRSGESGPWDYFRDQPLGGCHLAIDEAQYYVGDVAPKQIRERWMRWFSEIGHLGCTIELMSQHRNSISKECRDLAASEQCIFKLEQLDDPWFGISFGDWLELLAKLRGKWLSLCVVREYEAMGRTAKTHTRQHVYLLKSEYFQYYDSFSVPQEGGVAGKLDQYEFNKRGWISLIGWFISRNLYQLTTKLAIIAFVVWLLTGGIGQIMTSVVDAFKAQNTLHAQTHNNTKPQQTTAQPTPAKDQTPKDTIEPDPIHDQLREEVARLQLQLRACNEQRERDQIRLRDLTESQDRASAVVAVDESSITLRDGQIVALGDTITFGKWNNHVVEKIDLRRRAVTLSGGVLLRVGGLPVLTGTPAQSPAGPVVSSPGEPAADAGDEPPA